MNLTSHQSFLSGWREDATFSIYQSEVNDEVWVVSDCILLFVSVLMNCHTCYFNSKAAISFQCAPPNVRQYFGLTDEEREELDSYLELELQQSAGEAEA